jgi:hypothetical protein
MVTISSFQIPFSIGNVLKISGQTITPIKIGELMDGSIDRNEHPNKEFCVPIQLIDGTFRIVNCNEQGLIELVDSDDPRFINFVHHSTDMPQAYHATKQNKIRVYASNSQRHVFEVSMIKSNGGYILCNICTIGTE